MSRQLEVEHPLRIAGALLRGVDMALQNADPPATGGQRGSRGATGQAGADHHGAAFADGTAWPGEPGLVGHLHSARLQAAAQDFALVTVSRHTLHVEASLDQTATHETGAGKGAQGGARCR